MLTQDKKVTPTEISEAMDVLEKFGLSGDSLSCMSIIIGSARTTSLAIFDRRLEFSSDEVCDWSVVRLAEISKVSSSRLDFSVRVIKYAAEMVTEAETAAAMRTQN
jgi:hypothetical protein